MANLSLGIGVSDVSPPLGIELCGYGMYRGRRNRGVHDKLYSRSLILSTDDEVVILMNNDLIGLSDDILQDARKMIQRELGIKAENVIATCTHTHSGPATALLEGCGKMDDDYVKSLPEKFLESVSMAYNNLREAEVGFGKGEVRGLASTGLFPEAR